MHVPGNKAAWDDRRNTSRQQPVEVGAVKRALESTEAFRRASPAHAAWIEDGAPPIHSEEDHARLFGESYNRHRR